jgi:hypothetical protein
LTGGFSHKKDFARLWDVALAQPFRVTRIPGYV